MVTNEQERNKKLAEFAGFKYSHTALSFERGIMSLLNDRLNTWAGTSGIDFLSEDTGLSACFKYLVSKIMEDGYGYILSDSCGKKPHLFTLYCGYNEGEEKSIFSASAETPALALCRAISKLEEEK